MCLEVYVSCILFSLRGKYVVIDGSLEITVWKGRVWRNGDSQCATFPCSKTPFPSNVDQDRTAWLERPKVDFRLSTYSCRWSHTLSWKITKKKLSHFFQMWKLKIYWKMFEIEQFFSRLKYYHKRVPGQSFKSYTPFSLFPDFPATSLFQEFEPANFSLLTVRSVKDSEQNKI